MSRRVNLPATRVARHARALGVEVAKVPGHPSAREFQSGLRVIRYRPKGKGTFRVESFEGSELEADVVVSEDRLCGLLLWAAASDGMVE